MSEAASTSSSNDRPRKNRRFWRRPLFQWITGIVLGLILLLLLAWWQRLLLGRAVWDLAINRLADQGLYLGGDVDSIEWDEGISFGRLVLYDDSKHSVPLVALRGLEVRPVHQNDWGVRVRLKQAKIALYTSEFTHEITPVQGTVFISAARLEVEEVIAEAGSINLHLLDIRYDFDQTGSKETEPKPPEDEATRQSKLEKTIDDIWSWLDWSLGSDGRFDVEVRSLRASNEGIQRFDADINIDQATLPEHQLAIGSFHLKGNTDSASGSVLVTLEGADLKWENYALDDPFKAEASLSDDETDLQLQAKQFRLKSDHYLATFGDIEVEGGITDGKISLILNSPGGHLGGEDLPAIRVAATRVGQQLEIWFGPEFEPGAKPSELSLPEDPSDHGLIIGQLDWDGANHVLEIPRLVSTLDLWSLAGALMQDQEFFRLIESRSAPAISLSQFKADLSTANPTLSGTVVIERPAAFRWEERDLDFAIDAGSYVFDNHSLAINDLSATALSGPLSASGRIDWSDAENVLLELNDVSLAPDLARLTRLAELNKYQVDLAGTPTITADRVTVPLGAPENTEADNFLIDGEAHVRYGDLEGKDEQIIDATITHVRGNHRPWGDQLERLEGVAFGGEHLLGKTDVIWGTDDPHLAIDVASSDHIDLAALGAYLDTEQWNFRLGGSSDILVSDVRVPFDEAELTTVAAFSNSGEAEVSILLDGRELDLISRGITGTYGPGKLKVDQATAAIGEGSTSLEKTVVTWGEDGGSLEITAGSTDMLPLAPIAEFINTAQWDITAEGTSSSSLTKLHLPFSDPQQLRIEHFEEHGDVRASYKRNGTPLNFAISSLSGSYAPGGVDLDSMQGTALGGPSSLGETRIRWAGETRGVVSAQIQAQADLSVITEAFDLGEKKLRLNGSPKLTINQFQIDFADPAQANLDSFDINGKGSAEILLGEDHWLPVGLSRAKGRYNPGEVKLETLQGTLFEGTMNGSDLAATWRDGVQWTAPRLGIDNLSLSAVAVWLGQDPDGHLQGQLSSTASFSGSANPADLRGASTVVVTNGSFYSLPVLGPLNFLLKSLIPNLPADVAKDAQLELSVANNVATVESLSIESNVSRIDLEGDYNLDTKHVNANASVNLRGVLGIATFLLSEALTVHGEGPIDDVSFSFTYMPMPGLDQLEQLEQLPDNFLQLPGVRELPNVQRIPVLGEAIGTINNVRELPLLRQIPFLGRTQEDIKDNGDDGSRPGLLERLNPFRSRGNDKAIEPVPAPEE